jgi:hypothetical protein
MRDEDGIRVRGTNQFEFGRGFSPFFLGVHAGIQNDADSVHVEQITIRADVSVSRKIREINHLRKFSAGKGYTILPVLSMLALAGVFLPE